MKLIVVQNVCSGRVSMYLMYHGFFVIFNMWNKFCFSNHQNVSFHDFQEAVVDSEFRGRFSVTSVEIKE